MPINHLSKKAILAKMTDWGVGLCRRATCERMVIIANALIIIDSLIAVFGIETFFCIIQMTCEHMRNHVDANACK